MTSYQIATLAATGLGVATVLWLNTGVQLVSYNEKGEEEAREPGVLNVIAFLMGFGLGHLLATPFI